MSRAYTFAKNNFKLVGYGLTSSTAENVSLLIMVLLSVLRKPLKLYLSSLYLSPHEPFLDLLGIPVSYCVYYLGSSGNIDIPDTHQILDRGKCRYKPTYTR